MASRAVVARPPVLVTLGGSLITRQREKETIRPKVLARLAREVAAVRDPPVVLLHGSGSFGRPAAEEWGLDRGPDDGHPATRRTRGAAIVSSEVLRLHVTVLRELVRGGGSPFSAPPASFVRTREGRLASVHPATIAAALDAGAMPVSFGDVVPDEAWGFSILDAETLAAGLVPLLHPARVVFAGDVPGILDPSAARRTTVVPELSDAVVASLAPGPPTANGAGGVRATATAMRAIARYGVDAVLISGLTDGALSRAIRGESVYGSWAHASPREGSGPRGT